MDTFLVFVRLSWWDYCALGMIISREKKNSFSTQVWKTLFFPIIFHKISFGCHAFYCNVAQRALVVGIKRPVSNNTLLLTGWVELMSVCPCEKWRVITAKVLGTVLRVLPTFLHLIFRLTCYHILFSLLLKIRKMKLRHKELKLLVQGHTADKWRSLDANPGVCNVKDIPSTTRLCSSP